VQPQARWWYGVRIVTLDVSQAALKPMRARLRRPPSRHAVPGSLPVLFFGDVFTARVATVGLNPSDREYVSSRTGQLLTGMEQRFATLASLGAADRASVTDSQCDAALGWMRVYFRPGRPAYWRWFRGLERVLQGLGTSLSEGGATHLDLVQEATYPTWSALLGMSTTGCCVPI
jgi:hypothetical protein